MFVNVVGGLAVRDRGLDLAVAAAVLGAQLGLEVDREAVVIGEVGLRGEVRPVPRLEARLKEARAMGFGRAFVPACSGTARIPGLELREEDGKMFVDNVVFGSTAERQKIDFDFEIAGIQVKADRPPKQLFYIPALLMFGLIFFLQRGRRPGDDSPEQSTATAKA